MITGTTTSGFDFQISENVGDDYEILELMARIQKGVDLLAITELIDRVLGEDQKERFKDHCRADDGRVSTERMMTEFFEIFSSHNATKK